MANLLSAVPAGKRLAREDREWIGRFCDDVWALVFTTLDAEHLWDGDAAGKAAAVASDALARYLVADMAIDADPERVTPGVDVPHIAGLTC